MKRLKMLNNFFSDRLNILPKNMALFCRFRFLCTLFIAITIVSCTDSSTDGFKEADDRPTEEAPVYIITTSLPDGEVGLAYSEMLSAAGGDGNYTWQIASGNLPEGLTLNASTGEISGEPALDGSFDFAPRVASAGKTDSRSLNIAIAPVTEVTNKNTVINVDIMNSIEEMFGDEVYVGDDGILSSTNGSFWNPSDSGSGNLITGALDEFGESTFVEMEIDISFGNKFMGGASNNLQDHGVWSAGFPERGIEWRGLLAENEYDLALYVYHENSIEMFTTLTVTHAGGTITLSTSDDTTWDLPGEKDRDYFLLENITPYEISDDVFGFLIDNLSSEGSIVALQLKGLVPAPGE